MNEQGVLESEFKEQKNELVSAEEIVLYGNSVIACILRIAMESLGFSKRTRIFDKGKYIDNNEDSIKTGINRVIYLCSVRITTRASMQKDATAYFGNYPTYDFYAVYYYWISNVVIRDCDISILAKTLLLCREERSIPNIDSINTLFCNLNCKECSNGIQFRKSRRKITAEEQTSYLEKITEKMAITQCNFQGGEVFTDVDFGMFMLEHARNPRLAILTVATNGTIMPNDHQFDIIKGIGAMIRISDYGELSKARDKIIEKCNQMSIPCFIFPMAEKWRKFGDYKKRERSETELHKICKECCFGTHDLMFLGDRLYCCLRTLFGSVFGETEEVKKNTLYLNSDFSMNELEAIVNGDNLWMMCDYCDYPMDIIESAEQL